MMINENWAVSKKRIDEFFLSLDGIRKYGDTYAYKGCTVTLTETSGQVGSIPVSRTQIVITGDDEDVGALYKRFFLRFLSAGG